MLEAYLESQRGRYAANTLQLYASWLHQLARRGELLELGAAELVAFRQELCWKPGPSGRLYSEHSQNQAIGAIRSFYRWALSAGLLQTDPTAGLKMRAVPRKRVEKTDLRPLLLAPDPYTLLGIRDRAVLGVLAETGISQTACSRLDLDHLQTDTGALLSQGRRRQVHSLSDPLLERLECYLGEARPQLEKVGETALFLSQRGTRLSPASIHQLLLRHAG